MPLANPTARLLLAACLCLPLPACGVVSGRGPETSAPEEVLEKQIAGMEKLALAARDGSLLPFEHILVVVDEGLIQGLLSAVLPLEGDVSGGFHVRIESAQASFADGLPLLRLGGRVTAAGHVAAATLVVYAGMDTIDLNPASGLLRGRVSLYGLEVKEADIAGLDQRRLTKALAQGGLEALLPFVEVPLRFDNTVVLPPVRVHRLLIPATELRLRARVALVRAFAGKLWIAVEGSAAEEDKEPGDVPQGAP